MPERKLVQGTLELLILRTLRFGPLHGHGIAKHIQRTSEDVLQVEHGSLYPALQRLEDRHFVAAEWGTSDNNRKARFYAITKIGRRQLTTETRNWERIATIMARLLRRAEQP